MNILNNYLNELFSTDYSKISTWFKFKTRHAQLLLIWVIEYLHSNIIDSNLLPTNNYSGNHWTAEKGKFDCSEITRSTDNMTERAAGKPTLRWAELEC